VQVQIEVSGNYWHVLEHTKTLERQCFKDLIGEKDDAFNATGAQGQGALVRS